MRPHVDLAVQSRRQTKHQTAGKGFVRCFTALQAEGQVVFYGFPEGSLQFLNGSSLERDDVFEIEHLAVKETSLVIELDATLYSLYGSA